jgi:hypothetical protein
LHKYGGHILIIILLCSFTGCSFTPSETTIPAAPAPAQPLITEAPSILSFNIEPGEILAGELATLTWETEGSAAVEISPGIGTVSNSGQKTVQPDERTVYTIKASNSAGVDKKTVVITVNMNLKAKPIALSIEEMEDRGYGFYTNSEPSIRGAISTYYVIFKIDPAQPEFIDNTIYLYRTISEAESIFADDKFHNRNLVANSISIGTQGYYMIIPAANPENPATFSLFFQKNNAYVKLITNLPYPEMESLARIMESRVH